MKIIESQLVVSAQDKTAAALDSTVKRIESAIKSVENLRKAQERFASARSAMNQAQKAVEGAAKAMSGTAEPTRQMEAAYKRAQRAVSQASQAFEAQKSVLLGAKRDVESYGVAVTRLATEQGRLKNEAAQANTVLAQQAARAARLNEQQAAQAARMQRFRTGVGGIGAGVAGLYAGHLAREGVGKTVEAGAEGAHERVRMETSGMSPGEIAHAEEEAAKLSADFKSVSSTKIMHLLRNARSIVGTYEEAAHIMRPLLETYVVAQGAHPKQSEELEADFDKLVKGLEIKGVTGDHAKFESYLNGMAKALNVFGDTLRPTDYYEMFKYGRQATANLSEKFMLMTAPTLGQELGGSSAGKAFSSFYQAVVGGRIKQAAIKELQAYDLIDPSKIEKTKTGATKGLRAGGIVGSELAAADPYAWVNSVFLPALAKKGVTDPQRIQELIAVMFQQGTAAQFVALMATQQSRIEKDWKLVEGAQGREAAQTFLTKDPLVGMKSVTEQFTNLLQAASSPLVAPAAAGLNSIAAGLSRLTEMARDNPSTASTTLLGVLGGGMLTGLKATLGLGGRFGLISSSAASAPIMIPGTVALGGGILATKAANIVRDNPAAFNYADNPALAAMSGDFAIAGAIMNAATKPPAELKVVVEVNAGDGFWATVKSYLTSGAAGAVKEFLTSGSTGGVKSLLTGSTGLRGKSMPEAGTYHGENP